MCKILTDHPLFQQAKCQKAPPSITWNNTKWLEWTQFNYLKMHPQEQPKTSQKYLKQKSKTLKPKISATKRLAKISKFSIGNNQKQMKWCSQNFFKWYSNKKTKKKNNWALKLWLYWKRRRILQKKWIKWIKDKIYLKSLNLQERSRSMNISKHKIKKKKDWEIIKSITISSYCLTTDLKMFGILFQRVCFYWSFS